MPSGTPFLAPFASGIAGCCTKLYTCAELLHRGLEWWLEQGMCCPLEQVQPNGWNAEALCCTSLVAVHLCTCTVPLSVRFSFQLANSARALCSTSLLDTGSSLQQHPLSIPELRFKAVPGPCMATSRTPVLLLLLVFLACGWH